MRSSIAINKHYSDTGKESSLTDEQKSYNEVTKKAAAANIGHEIEHAVDKFKVHSFRPFSEFTPQRLE